MLEFTHVILAGVLGASVASFGQCAITRSILGRSWVSGRSTCDYCGHKLAWYENIPIVSFIIQGGKTRCCQKKLAPTYVICEILGAALFIILTVRLV